MKPISFIAFLCLLYSTSATAQSHNSAVKNKLFSELISMQDVRDTAGDYYTRADVDTSLMKSILDKVTSGAIPAWVDSGYTQKMPVAEIYNLISSGAVIDTEMLIDLTSGYEIIKTTVYSMDFYRFNDLTIMGSADLSAVGSGRFTILGVGISKLRNLHAPEGAKSYPSTPVRTFFWLKYADIKDLFDKYDAAHTDNTFASRIARIKVPDVDVIDYAHGDKYIGHTKNGRPEGKGYKYYSNREVDDTAIHGYNFDGDPSWYEGEWKNGQREGKGTLTFMQGIRYSGEWKNDKMNGTGVYYIDSNDRYEGHFENSNYNGNGTYYSKGKIQYAGEWKDDKKSGKGVYYTDSSGRYEGAFKDNRFNGTGTYFYIDSSKYIGEWKNDNRDGVGILKYADGAMYIGAWKSDKMSGKGILYHSDSDVYAGEFLDGDMSGKGTFYYHSGSKYIGHFEHDNFDGYGTYYSKNGDKYECQWKDDVVEDHGTYYFSNGDKYEGQWDIHVHFNGKGICYYIGGDKYDGDWINDYRSGYGAYTVGGGTDAEINNCPGCKVYKGEWKNGNKDGVGTCYDKDMKKIYEGRFVDNKPVDQYPSVQ